MADSVGDAEARIRTLEKEWLAAQARRDLDGMVARYAPDAWEMLPDAVPQVGREAIRAFFASLFEARARWFHEMTIERVDVAASLDLAVARGTFRVTYDSERPDEFDDWKFVSVWRFREGDWRIVTNIYNRNPRSA